MDFRLVYRGPLKSSGNDVEKDRRAKNSHKLDIRRQLHGQIRELWKYPPLNFSYGRSTEPTHLPFLDPQLPEDYHAAEGESPLFCLLEDDALITKITLAADTLLDSSLADNYVHLVVHVRVNGPDRSIVNIAQWG